jgi:hypothetical protein
MRSTRMARSTEKAPLAGTSAMAVTARSNNDHGSRKNALRWANSRKAISITKTAKVKRSAACSSGPFVAMSAGEASSPNITALMKMMPMITSEKRLESTSASTCRRNAERLRSALSAIVQPPFLFCSRHGALA